MKYRHAAFRMVCVVVVLIAGLAGSLSFTSATAQATYTAPNSAAVINAGGQWTIDEELTESGEGYDVVSFARELDSVLISFLPSGTDLVMARDIVLNEFQVGFDNYTVLDRGAYGTVSYSLDIVAIEEVEVGVFTLFLGQRASGYVEVYMYLAPTLVFESGFAEAQRDISVNGVNIFDGVEGSGLQELLNSNAGTTGGSTSLPSGNVVNRESEAQPTAPSRTPTQAPVVNDPTEPPTEEAVEEEESGSRSSRRLPARATDPQNEEAIESENESETGRGGQGVDLTDFEDLGLVSETEYVSPQYDVEIVWDENWYFDDSTTDPIVSDTEAEVDSISITWAGESYVVAYVDIMSSGGFVPEDYVDYWTSEEYMSTSTAPDSEILLDDVTDSSGAVLYRDYLEDGTEISVLSEMACLDRRCDLVSITMMIGLPTSFGDAYADVEGGIQVDGDPLFVTFSPRQIDRAID